MTKIPRPSIFVCSPFYPPHIGGLESHAADWNTRLAQEGHAITVFTPALDSTYPQQELQISHNQPIRIVRFPAFELIGNYPVPKLWQAAFWTQLKKASPASHNLIVSRTRFFPTSLIALLLSRRHHLPHLHVEHGAGYVHMKNPILKFLGWLYDHTLGALVLHQADHIVANSKASSRFIQALSPQSKPTVIYRGVNTPVIQSIPSPTLPRNQPPQLLFVGRLIEGKGVSDLIKAVRKIKAPYQLHIIGDGPARQALEKTAAQNSSIIFHGLQTWDAAIKHLKSSDIVINPSYTEGLPTTLIEATLCQKAVIATSVGGTPEIIKHNYNGLLYPAGNIDALSKTINTLLTNPSLRTRLANAKPLQDFSWQNTTHQYEVIINTLCPEPS